MRIKKILLSAFWIFPFLLFVLGYYSAHCFFHAKKVETPNVIGKTIQKSIKTASALGLNIRLIREKVDPDVIEGVVLEQTPEPYTMIKPTQHIFVTIAKQPKSVIVPKFFGKGHSVVVEEGKKVGVRPKSFWLESNYPKNVCFAQFPQPEKKLKKQPLITYFSQGKNQLYVFPNLSNFLVKEVKTFLEKENIKVDIFHDDQVDSSHDCNECIVAEQKPMAGAIIDVSKKVYVQLRVARKR